VSGSSVGPAEAAAAAQFERLFAEGREALLAGTHRAESPPEDGRARWGIGAALRPDPAAAAVIEDCARQAATVIGGTPWLAGARRSSHLTLRAGLEPHRSCVPAGDQQVARYVTALRRATHGVAPIRFDVTGLTLTPVSVMACAAPADSAANELATAFGAALSALNGQAAPGRTPDFWYLNLAYFTGPVRPPGRLIDWVAARRSVWLTSITVTEVQLMRWRHTRTGMIPVPLCSIRLAPGKPDSLAR
jgi:hypothetical protein